jgi:hypothetical protein
MLDEQFNEIYARLLSADGVFVVAAHYAPIPSKLAMLLEKVEQLAFLPRFRDESQHSPLYKRPVGIIGHCGNADEASLKYYKGPVLETIANALSWPVEMSIVGAGEDWPHGIMFPVGRVSKDENSVFPQQEYNWQDVQRRIEPLVKGVLQRIAK